LKFGIIWTMNDTATTSTECKNREYWTLCAKVLSMESEKEAIKNFRETPEAQCLDNSDMIFEALADAIKSVRDSRPPNRISAFAAKELKQILSTKTWTECLKFDANSSLSDDEFLSADEKKAVLPYWDDIWTDEYGTWRQIVVSLAAFLREAAAFAKRVGSIDSARKFILAWLKVNRFEKDIFGCMSQEDACSVVDAIAEAEDILLADMELAKL